MKHEIFINSDAVTNASSWYEQHFNNKPTHEEFEQYFHCKMHDLVIQFNNRRDYTYFILTWGR